MSHYLAIAGTLPDAKNTCRVDGGTTAIKNLQNDAGYRLTRSRTLDDRIYGVILKPDSKLGKYSSDMKQII